MGIGASIAMICIGAILTFGIRRYFAIMDWVDINLVGWVLMIGGVIGLVITVSMWASNRRETHVIERHHNTRPPY